jgi:hypothetical protein
MRQVLGSFQYTAVSVLITLAFGWATTLLLCGGTGMISCGEAWQGSKMKFVLTAFLVYGVSLCLCLSVVSLSLSLSLVVRA